MKTRFSFLHQSRFPLVVVLAVPTGIEKFHRENFCTEVEVIATEFEPGKRVRGERCEANTDTGILTQSQNESSIHPLDLDTQLIGWICIFLLRLELLKIDSNRHEMCSGSRLQSRA